MFTFHSPLYGRPTCRVVESEKVNLRSMTLRALESRVGAGHAAWLKDAAWRSVTTVCSYTVYTSYTVRSAITATAELAAIFHWHTQQ